MTCDTHLRYVLCGQGSNGKMISEQHSGSEEEEPEEEEEEDDMVCGRMIYIHIFQSMSICI